MIEAMYGGTHCHAYGFQATTFSLILFCGCITLLLHNSRQEKAVFQREEEFERLGTGYRAIQGTGPQTLEYFLADSPAGLLAWIYDKLREWTDGYPWTKDEVLTWVSIYMFSREGPAASSHIYYEVAQLGQRDLAIYPMSKVPLGISFLPKEIYHPPRDYARTLGNVVFEREHGCGGHFVAYEKPELLADDLRAMFGKNCPAFGVVPGKTGYDQVARAVVRCINYIDIPAMGCRL